MATQSVQQGWNQATAAQRAIMGMGLGAQATRRATGGKRRKRRSAAPKRRASSSRKRRSAPRRVARLVKGSAAAKRYMARIRKMRRKRA